MCKRRRIVASKVRPWRIKVHFLQLCWGENRWRPKEGGDDGDEVGGTRREAARTGELWLSSGRRWHDAPRGGRGATTLRERRWRDDNWKALSFLLKSSTEAIGTLILCCRKNRVERNRVAGWIPMEAVDNRFHVLFFRLWCFQHKASSERILKPRGQLVIHLVFSVLWPFYPC
jgi:hypothetical protein